MIAWILGVALVLSLLVNWIQYGFLGLNEDYENDLRQINGDLQEELKRTGTHRDELQARYRDQEAERIASTEKAAKRSERARKASQARWGKKVAA